MLLDGSVSRVPDNVLLYATSNRRHLLPEKMSDNLDTRMRDGEIHHSEMIEERISLSERFGLSLAFHPFSQDDFLAIVSHWLEKLGVDKREARKARQVPLRWVLSHGSRSGRPAWQFACDWAGKKGLDNIGR